MERESVGDVAYAHGLDPDRAALWEVRLAEDAATLAGLKESLLARADPVYPGALPVVEPLRLTYGAAESPRPARADEIQESLARAHGDALACFTDVFQQARTTRHGFLASMTLGVKDLIDIRGRRITGATRALRVEPALDDAPVVSRLLEHGAQLVGALNLHALAYGATGQSSDWGAAVNPRAPEHIAGGSSSGSAAAVASGLVDLALGTDTSGSIRIPAALCGVVGFKPTLGAISLKGVHPLAPSLDHVGALARSVPDVALARAAMTDSEVVPTVARLSEVIIGLPQDYFLLDLEPQVRQVYDQALDFLRDAGATVVAVDLSLARYCPGAQLAILSREAFQVHRALLAERAAELTEDVRLRLEVGAFKSMSDFEVAQKFRARWRHQVDDALTRCHALLTPTMATTAPRIGQLVVDHSEENWTVQSALTRLTLPFNLSGHPAISLPWDVDRHGAGIAVQLIGARGCDEGLLSIAAGCELAKGESGVGH